MPPLYWSKLVSSCATPVKFPCPIKKNSRSEKMPTPFRYNIDNFNSKKYTRDAKWTNAEMELLLNTVCQWYAKYEGLTIPFKEKPEWTYDASGLGEIDRSALYKKRHLNEISIPNHVEIPEL